MSRFKDLTGMRFGRLSVVSKAESIRESYGLTRAVWNCTCDCGNHVSVKSGLLLSGKTKSCGCLKHEHSYNFDDLTSRKFGRLFVLNVSERNTKSKIYYDCLCECGKLKTVASSELKSGHTRSCGCLARELISERNTKHGLSVTRLRGTWRNMISRCENPDNSSYPNYGGRGIKVCDEWHDLACFAAWAKSVGYIEGAPRKEQTIDRIDVNGNYEPDNCRISNMTEQCRNKRNNRLFDMGGKTITMQELSEMSGVNRATISYRLSRGKSASEAIGGFLNENEIKEINIG